MKVINLFLAVYAIISFAAAIFRPTIMSTESEPLRSWSDSIHRAFDSDNNLLMKQQELQHRIRMSEYEILNLKVRAIRPRPVSDNVRRNVFFTAAQ